MKLTDVCIIFLAIWLCFDTIAAIQNRRVSKEQLQYQQINLVCDEAVEDSLRLAIVPDEAEIPVVDFSKLRDGFVHQMAVTTGTEEEEVKGRIVGMLYVDEDRFYSLEKGEWNYVLFQGKKHEEQVAQIREYLEKLVWKKVQLPLNDGEDFKNTIHTYGCVAIYQYETGKMVFSGAEIT